MKTESGYKQLIFGRPCRNLALACLLVMIAAGTVHSQITVFNEDFETDGNGLPGRYTQSSQFFDLVEGIFDQTTNLTHASTGNYTGQSGLGIFASEDTDDPAGNEDDEQTVTFVFDIAGREGLEFSGLFAAGTASFDNDDHIFVDAQIDAQAVQRLLAFESLGNTNSTAVFQDTSLDGEGDGTQLALGFSSFSAPILGMGNMLTLTLRVEADAVSESVAFDNFSVTAIPEPSAVGLLMLLGASCYWRRRR